MRTQPARYYLNDAVVQAALDRHHLTHHQFAVHLGYSRSHWSGLVNRHRPLTPKVRQDLAKSKYLRDLDPDALWDIERDVDSEDGEEK